MSGVRAGYLRTGKFDLAVRFRTVGARIGEVFAFTSGLYFRGKLTYANTFGTALVITSDRGLVPADTVIGPDDVAAFGAVDIDPSEPRYVGPLQRDAAALAGEMVLLGSLATPKYVVPLSAVLGDRLLVPPALIGQGDMKRGAMLLACARAREPLAYTAWTGLEVTAAGR